jgi:uncharacterized membrane protein
MHKAGDSIWKYLRTNFIAGVTALLPLWAVIIVVSFLVNLVNDKLLKPILGLVHPYVSWADPEVVRGSLKLALFIGILFLIVLFGVLVKNFFVRRILGFGEKVLIKIPLVNKIYVSMQQISRTFIVEKQAVFKKSVLIEYPRKGCYVLGFLTAAAASEIQNKTRDELVSVFVPTTPNPTSGFLVFVPKKEMIELSISIEDSFKLVVSFGAVMPQ